MRALGFLPNLGGKTLLVETTHSLPTEHMRFKLQTAESFIPDDKLSKHQLSYPPVDLQY